MAKYNGIEKYIFSDMYLFFLKYKDIPNDEYYWNACLEDAKMLMFKWKNHPFAQGMLSQTLNQLEHVVSGRPLNELSREQWEETLVVAKEGKAFNSTNPFNSGK